MNADFLSHEDAAQLNRNRVLQYIKTNGYVSRTDIWNNLNISRASVTQIIRQLQDLSLILENEKENETNRRMSRYLCFNKNARYLYVFDWNTHQICFANIGGDVLQILELHFPSNCLPQAFADIVLSGVKKLSELHSVDKDAILGLGIIMPGLIDSREATVLYSVELGWRDVNVQALFSAEFGMNVFLERTGNMIALGESFFGAGQAAQHVMLILLENEGIGLSTVVHGDCQHGSNYMYGELGHIKLPSTVVCSCGQQGCLEAVVLDCLRRNDGNITNELLDYVSFGVAAAVNISDPKIVLLAGKIARSLSPSQQTYLIHCIRSKITNERARAFSVHICQEEKGIAIQGMAAYVFQKCFPI